MKLAYYYSLYGWLLFLIIKWQVSIHKILKITSLALNPLINPLTRCQKKICKNLQKNFLLVFNCIATNMCDNNIGCKATSNFALFKLNQSWINIFPKYVAIVKSCALWSSIIMQHICNFNEAFGGNMRKNSKNDT